MARRNISNYLMKRKLLNLLLINLNNQNWITKSEYIDTDIFLHGGYRKTNNVIIRKVNLCKHTKKINKFYDLKLSLNIEYPIDVIKNNLSTELIRRKKRFSFYKDFYRFDLTIVNNDIYEVEMELVDITYARKHSFDFIINNMINIFQNLISSSNFKLSTWLWGHSCFLPRTNSFLWIGWVRTKLIICIS